MKAKEKIIEAAIECFNEKGIGNVSIRDIANRIGMSSGNFAYHFKNKEAVLEHFYSHMYDEVQIPTELKEGEGFKEFNVILQEIISFMNGYSFFYTDIVDIFRLCPSIAEQYASNYEGRKEIYKGFIRHFNATGLIHDLDEEELDALTHSIWFTMTFWQSQRRILPISSSHVDGAFAINQIWRLLMPYMTDVGKTEFIQISH